MLYQYINIPLIFNIYVNISIYIHIYIYTYIYIYIYIYIQLTSEIEYQYLWGHVPNDLQLDSNINIQH